MTIITRQRSDNFAIIPNAVAEDNRLSFSARGLLVYLLAKPNNWQVRIEDIRTSGGIGRDQAYKLLAELKAAGYIVIETKRTAANTYASHNYIVYDNAVVEKLPLPENTEVDAPLTENTEVAEPLPDFPVTGEHGRIIRTNNKTNTQSSPYPRNEQQTPQGFSISGRHGHTGNDRTIGSWPSHCSTNFGRKTSGWRSGSPRHIGRCWCFVLSPTG